MQVHFSAFFEIFNIGELLFCCVKSITASPISNHVSKYWSPLEVKYNDRFSWTAQHFAHMRNYAELNMSFGPNGCKLRVEMKLFDTPDPPEEH